MTDHVVSGHRTPAALARGLNAIQPAKNFFSVGGNEESLHSRKRSALAVLEFFVPSHLDGFEFGFVGGGGIAGEAGKFGDPFVHVREADGEGIGVRKFVGQADSYVFEVVQPNVGGICSSY